MTTRRKFIKVGAATIGVGAFMQSRWLWSFSQTPTGLSKFAQPLIGLGPTGIPVASPDPTLSTSTYDYYKMDMVEFSHQFHPSLPASKVWGYNPVGNATPGYLGGVSVVQKNRAAKYLFTNKLPTAHPLPVDDTIMGVKGYANNRTSIHLHGGFVDWTADGGPHHWFDGQGNFGESCDPLVRRGKGKIELHYPNQQSARALIMHDHALGITRQNVYAGIATAYLIRDPIENGLVQSGVIPSREIPLVIQDKTFFDGKDPNYSWGGKGSLWYPYLYEATGEPGSCGPSATGRWDYGPCATPPGAVAGPLPKVSSVPEFFSDTIVVNGAAYPFVQLEQRHYRFRVFNASQARFYNLMLFYASAGSPTEVDQVALPDGRIVPDPKTAKKGPRIIQIGNECGLLPFPVVWNDPPKPCAFDTSPGPTNGNVISHSLLLAPGERADIVIDFSHVPAGSKLILYNDAPAPFPGGDPLNDYYTGAPDQTGIGGVPMPQPGKGPNTRTLMQIQVVPRVGAADPLAMSTMETSAVLGQTLAQAAVSTLVPAVTAIDVTKAVRIRNLTLNEDFDEYGRLIQMLGTDVVSGVNSQNLPTFSRPYEAAPTEDPKVGDIEIWRIFNTTGDTHPMHFHLVDVQVLGRRPYTYTVSPKGKLVPTYTGPAKPPALNELGYREVVRCNPGEMTEVIMHFQQPTVPYKVPMSQRLLKTYGISAYEYVWHCHILEHEEHDMMRPIAVKP